MLAMNKYSLDDIAELATISKVAVFRKFKKSSILPIAFERSGGRPIALYGIEALRAFPQLREYVRQIETAENKQNSKAIEDEKLKIVSKSKGKPRVLSQEMIAHLAKITKKAYLEQGNINNLKLCAERAVADNWQLVLADLEKNGTRAIKSTGELRSLEKVQWHFYGACLMRKDNASAKAQGIALVENWRELWRIKHKVAMMNGLLPTARYRYLPILEEMGAIGQGFGAGCLWVIDGTQMDAFVEDERGKLRAVNYIAISDAVSFMPLYMHKLENGESIADVAEAIIRCAMIHGVPRMGIVADNGRAFRSLELQSLVNSLYAPEALEGFASCPLRRALFKGQKGAIMYPEAKKPNSPIKGKIENMFRELNRSIQLRLAASYIGGTDAMRLSHELGSVPTVALRNALPSNVAFDDFIYSVYTDFVARPQPASEHLGYMRTRYKLDTSPLTAWQFYGGIYNLDEEKKSLELSAWSPVPLSDGFIPYYYFAVMDKSNRHLVKSGRGSAVLIHNRETYNLVDADIFSLSRLDEKLTVVIDAHGKIGHVFSTEQERIKDDTLETITRTKNLEYLGSVRSAVISSLSDVQAVKKQVRTARQKYEAQANALIPSDVKIENKAGINPERIEIYSSNGNLLNQSQSIDLPPSGAGKNFPSPKEIPSDDASGSAFYLSDNNKTKENKTKENDGNHGNCDDLLLDNDYLNYL